MTSTNSTLSSANQQKPVTIIRQVSPISTNSYPSGNTVKNNPNNFTVPANNSSATQPQQQLYCSHTNMIVKSVTNAVSFYQNAFGWEIIKSSENAAVMQYKNYTFYIVSENSVTDFFGYTAVSPQTSGHSPSMTTTLLCDDVAELWNKALIAGAIPVKSPYTKSNGSTCATLVGPENYIWFITDSNNFFC